MQTQIENFVPVILSGGSGTRLWPVSRPSLPKQFAPVLQTDNEDSLFSRTVKRLSPLGVPWVVTVEEMRVLTEKAVRDEGIGSGERLYEPRGRNTAAAIALVCRVLQLRDLENTIVGVFPADHLIEDSATFQNAVRGACEIAQTGEIVTLGIRPTYPATGYGYIETSENLQRASRVQARRAVRFCEKPDIKTAKMFLQQNARADSGEVATQFLWNAGMFVFNVNRVVQLFEEHAPLVWRPMTDLKSDLSNLIEVYERVEAKSFDYAIMEYLPSHVTIPCEFGWSDVGSWDAIANLSEANLSKPNGVQKSREITSISIENKNNFVHGYEGKTYAFVGVDDLIVVDTQDVAMVTKRGSSERVKDIVEALKQSGDPKLVSQTQKQPFEVRPWGSFEILRDTDTYKSKVITVEPGAQLSLQSHKKRAEHWIIVQGEGEVVLDDKKIPVEAGSHVFIPIGTKHRIRNSSPEKRGNHLVFIEVQLGTYFGEDDIIRYEDNYGRVQSIEQDR